MRPPGNPDLPAATASVTHYGIHCTLSKRRFSDYISLVVGILVGVALGLFVLAGFINVNTLNMADRADPEYQAEVLERIKPFGRVALLGETVEEDHDVVQVSRVEPVAEVQTGPQVYNIACIACHGAGIAGAPATGNVEAWQPRIGQGAALLQEHALQGYQGQTGYMPPKGGRLDLSDEEIIAAIDYMVGQSQ